VKKFDGGEEKLSASPLPLLLCLAAEETGCRNAFTCRRLLTAPELLAYCFFFLLS